MTKIGTYPCGLRAADWFLHVLFSRTGTVIHRSAFGTSLEVLTRLVLTSRNVPSYSVTAVWHLCALHLLSQRRVLSTVDEFGPVANGPLGPPVGAVAGAGDINAPEQQQAASSAGEGAGKGSGGGAAPTPVVRKNFPETWIWVDALAK